MHKLSNDELAEKVRAANRRRSERQRARRVSAGRAAFTIWIPADLQCQIVELATAESATTSAIATRLLTAGLAALTTQPATLETIASTPAMPESLPLFEPVPTESVVEVEGNSLSVDTTPAPGPAAERDALIVQLHRQGLSLDKIALVLAEQGITTANNTPLSKSTIARALRKGE